MIRFGSASEPSGLEQGGPGRRAGGGGPPEGLGASGTDGVPDPGIVVGFVALVAALFLLGGVPLQLRYGERGLLAAQWLFLFVPAVAFVGLGRFDAARTLSLRRPSASAVAGSVALIAGAVPLVWLLGWLQSFVLPVPGDVVEGLRELVTAESRGRLIWLLVLLAVSPAVCEEIVFRGVLLSGTRRLGPARLVVLNGAVFGVFHLSFETAIRFLPTASLGIVIAWAVWRAGSLWVGVLMHLLNNGAIVVLASAPASSDLFADPDAPPPLWLVPIAATVLGIGVRLLRAGPPPEGSASRESHAPRPRPNTSFEAP